LNIISPFVYNGSRKELKTLYTIDDVWIYIDIEPDEYDDEYDWEVVDEEFIVGRWNN
jgi:hypothetical protein